MLGQVMLWFHQQATQLHSPGVREVETDSRQIPDFPDWGTRPTPPPGKCPAPLQSYPLSLDQRTSHRDQFISNLILRPSFSLSE